MNPKIFWVSLFFLTMFVFFRLKKYYRTVVSKKTRNEIKPEIKTQEKDVFKPSDKKPKPITNQDNREAKTQIKRHLPEAEKVLRNTVNKDLGIKKEITRDVVNPVNEQVNIVANQEIIKKQRESILPESKKEEILNPDTIKFVDFDVKLSDILDSFPIRRFPKKGTVVRSYRIGNSKRRGYKEDTFQKSIQEIFGNDFNIIGNLRLNTGKETRPFEPDIAIIDINHSNLRIDVEIDEPYAGISRQPTHCKNEDTLRDLYFADRGWVVIRFSEYQVHTQESECLLFIAQTIKLALPQFEIPTQLLNVSTLKNEAIWDIVQAQKWEKIKYREKYLNHEFQFIEEEEETIERDFNSTEKEEESCVDSTIIGVLDTKKAISFNLKNRHVRDHRIEFYPEPHVYKIDSIPAPSASTIISKFFPEFDSISAACRLNPNHELFGLEIEQIVNIWKERGESAAKKGTFLHEQIENFYLKQDYIPTEEFHLFEQFVNEHQTLNPFRTEWRIFDEEYNIAGTIDLITKNGDTFDIYDWKRSKKIINTYTGLPITNNQWQHGVGQLSDLDDTSYNRYSLQQSLYKYILEKNYGIKISKMYLIVLYPEYDNYYKVEVPYLKERAEYILKTL